jgi:hypothetical protein
MGFGMLNICFWNTEGTVGLKNEHLFEHSSS